MCSQINRVVISAFISVFLVGMTVTPAHGQFGVAAGLNFESAEDIDTGSGNATFENSTGYHLGIVYDASTGPLKFRPGVLYRKVGEYEFPTSRVDVERFEVPLDVKLVLPVPFVNPYLLGGPMVVFPRVDGEFGDDFKDTTYSLNVGIGAEISLGSGSSLQPEIRYEYGLSDYTEDDFLVDTEDSPRFQGVALRLHATF